MVDWAVEFYQEADGTAPVEEFLDSLRPEGRAKALALLQMLKDHGPKSAVPVFIAGCGGGSANYGRNMAGTRSDSLLRRFQKNLHSAPWIRKADGQT